MPDLVGKFAALAMLSLVLVLAGCPRDAASPGGGNTAGWTPGEGLPPEWPIKELTLPADAKPFEGHVDNAQDGGRDVTVFYSTAGDFHSQLAHVEGQLGPLDYRRMPPGTADGAPAGQNQAWMSPSGQHIVFLAYEEDAGAAKTLGQPGYFTLLVKQLKDALPPDPAWESIK